MTSGYTKPIPDPTPETQPYWDYCKQRELRIQQCRDCGARFFYPRGQCPECLSPDTDWIKASGRGTIYSYSIVRRPPGPAFQPDVPYVVALIDLEEGVRMMSNVEGSPVEAVKIGLPVEVFFEDVSETIALPKFRLAS